MNMAQQKVYEMREWQVHSILDAIFMANDGVSQDENFLDDRIATFTFTYIDESELKIGTDGLVYSDNDYQYQIY